MTDNQFGIVVRSDLDGAREDKILLFGAVERNENLGIAFVHEDLLSGDGLVPPVMPSALLR